jgi:hypothetical protein
MKIFSEILRFEEKIIECALGEFGLSLLRFSKVININHFGIYEIPINDDLSEKLCQILNLVDYALKNNLNLSVDGINKFYTKCIDYNLINLDKKYVRLIKDEKTRKEIRKNKKISEVSLSGFYEKARLIWNNLPEDFSIFSKNDTSFEKIIADAESKADRYDSVGCYELSKNIRDSIDVVKDIIKDSYCGYRRISIKNASVILAKINRFELVVKNLENSFHKKKYLICLNNEIYNPKIYPIHYLEDIKTDYIKSLFIDLESTPLFDHYMVLVPSFNSRQINQDLIDIKEKNAIPILLGEKDGKCYFISYWI